MSLRSVPFSHPWSEDVIGNFAHVTVGGTPSTSIDIYWGGDVQWMASGDVHLKKIRNVSGRISELGLRHSNATLVRPPAVAIALAGQGRTRGTVALVLCTLCTNQSVALITTNSTDIAPEYLFYNLEFRYEELRSRSAGDGRAGLSKQLIEQIPVPVPDMQEQNKIAHILSTVDQAIEQTEGLIAKHQRIHAGLMQDLFTRGIDENNCLRSERTHKFQDSLLGRIPADWDFTELGSVSEFVTSGSRGWARYYSKEGQLFLRIGNLTRDHINLRLDDIILVNPPASSEGKRTSVAAGDILISITADLGIIGVIPAGFREAYTNQHIALVRPSLAKVDPRFIGWFLSSYGGKRQFDRLNEAGAKAGLNLPTIKRLTLPIPRRISEQVRIANILDANTQEIDGHRRRRAKLRCLKTALMQVLLSGNKRVVALVEPTARPTAEVA